MEEFHWRANIRVLSARSRLSFPKKPLPIKAILKKPGL